MKYIIAIVITASVFVYGVLVGEYQIFPFEQLQLTKQFIAGDNWLEKRCHGHVKRYAFFAQIAKEGNAKHVFFGDSVVDGLRSENFFGIAYSKMASSGNIVECLDLIGSDLIALKPQNIIIYLGGNDADGQGRQSVTELSASYLTFIEKLNAIGTNVVIHGIHRGYPGTRDQSYADDLNDSLRNIAGTTNSHFIEPFGLLDFAENQANFDELTYDGEHLKAAAYLQWLEYIDRNLPESFPKFLVTKNSK